MTTLAPFLDKYIAGRKDLAPASRVSMTQCRNKLVEFFQDRPLDKITPGDADEFSHWLHSKLGDNTARRTLGRAKQFFRAAHRKRMIAHDPLADLTGTSVRPNSQREYFVSRAETDRLLGASATNRWQLIVGLARFGGIRIPSELFGLLWEHIDFERGRMTVTSPKTANHAKHSRVVPIFPELRPLLVEGWRQASELLGKSPREPVIPAQQASTVRRGLLVILKRAGLTPWPKLFQNLRASRQTELVREFPVHVVCAWLGNSPAVALRHYLQVREEDFQKAIQ